MSEVHEAGAGGSSTIQYVTVMIAEQLFGLPISQVHDVFMPDGITRVPMSSPEVAGVLNLRGRIVTAIDMRRRLNLPPRATGENTMAVGIEFKGESYGLIIDSVGEVLDLDMNEEEPKPANLDRRWAAIASGVYRLDGQLLVVIDVAQLLEAMMEPAAA